MTAVACLLVLGKDAGISQVISLSPDLSLIPSPLLLLPPSSASLFFLPLSNFSMWMKTFRVSADRRGLAVTQLCFLTTHMNDTHLQQSFHTPPPPHPLR